jgi:hypothetical protein
MPSVTLHIPEVGQAVRVRNRLATVRAVEPYDSRGAQGRLHVVDVEYLDDCRYPEAEQLLWEVEATATVLGKISLPGVDAHRPDSPQGQRSGSRTSPSSCLCWSSANPSSPCVSRKAPCVGPRPTLTTTATCSCRGGGRSKTGLHGGTKTGRAPTAAAPPALSDAISSAPVALQATQTTEKAGCLPLTCRPIRQRQNIRPGCL